MFQEQLQLTITPTQHSSLQSPLIARVSSQGSGGTAVLRTAEQFTAELHAAHCTPCDDTSPAAAAARQSERETNN